MSLELESSSSGTNEGALDSLFTSRSGANDGGSVANASGAAPTGADDAGSSAAPVSAAAPTPAAAPAPAAASAATTASGLNLRSMAQAFGLDGAQYKDDSEFGLHLLQQLQQLQPYAQFGRELAPQRDAIQKFLADQKQQAEQAAAQQQQARFADRWSAPKWKSDWTDAINKGFVVPDPNTGLFVAKPGLEAHFAGMLGDLNNAYQARQTATRAFFDGNPYESMHDALRGPMQEAWKADIAAAVKEALGGYTAQTQEEAFVSQFEAKHAAELYADPVQKTLSDKGKAFENAIDSLKQFNPNASNQQLLEMAARMVNLGAAPANPAKPATPAAPAAPAKPSFLEKSRNRAAHSPSSSGSAAAGGGPAVRSEAELDRMFLAAAASQS